MDNSELLKAISKIKDEQLRSRLLKTLHNGEAGSSWVLNEAKRLGFKPKATREYVQWTWGLGYVAEITGGAWFIVVGIFFLFVVPNIIFGICFPIFGAVSILNGIKQRRMIESKKKGYGEK